MNSHRKSLVLAVQFCLIAVVGCAPKYILQPDADYIAANEDTWLSRAYRYEENGWIFIHTEGKPFERGFQRGYLTADEIEDFWRTLSYTQHFYSGRKIDFFTDAAAKLFKNKVSPEYVAEMQGMVAGMQRAGKDITYDQMLLMNGFIDIAWYWYPKEKDNIRDDGPGCSAFVATGDATAGGKIVMAHNTWSPYATVRFCNIIVEIVPDKGNNILMQSWGPCIYSATDFFITSAGLIGTETTISGFKGFNEKGRPVFERARRAMQYADSIDQWAQIMIEDNSGAYANSWLLGDTKSGEIAQLELGLKHHRLTKKTDGYFTGSNVADDIKILRRETDATYDDIRNSCVARRTRWRQLMEQNYGTIDVESAKKMLADHYDVYLQKENPSCRTICGHMELDDGMLPYSPSPYRPSGAIDGKVVDSEMAQKWRIAAKWGHSCDIEFDAEEFLREHPQYDWLDGWLVDLPAHGWTILPKE